MSDAVQHVMPGWEYHEPSPLCPCEPRYLRTASGILWSHDAKVCSDGREHQWSSRTGECIRCGQSMPHAVVPSTVAWPL